MTEPVQTSAPGKLVLIGEYAVLFGAPAVVIAVNRRARVELVPSAGGRWSFTAPGLAAEPADLELGANGDLSWLGDAATARRHFGLVERLLNGLTEAGIIEPRALPPLAATLDTRAFFDGSGDERKKLGLGSSAALTVALASALLGWAGKERPPDPEWLRTLVDLHRGMQGGLGSGIDVAASLLGGVVRYQLEGAGVEPVAAALALPEDLQMLCIWTGRPASTGDLLARLEASREEDPQAVEQALGRLGEVSVEGVGALERGRSADFLEVVEAFWDALEDLGREIGLPILSDEHRRLHRLASEFGVRYKPSGAGGGDFGLAFTTDPGQAAAMAARATADGFKVLDLRVDPVGLACNC